MGREWRGVGALEEEVAVAGQARAEGLGGCAPEEEGFGAIGGKGREDLGDEGLPSPAFVAVRLMKRHGEGGVEQNNPLVRPSGEITIGFGLAGLGALSIHSETFSHFAACPFESSFQG